MIIEGTIIPGAGQATEAFSLPTANIHLEDASSNIPAGVYASRATVAGKTYDAVTFIGQAHLLPDRPWRLETHCLDQQLGDLAGQRINIELLKHLRPSIVFTSAEQAQSVIADDVKNARAFFQT